jgi:hypothetical protein
VIRAFSRKQLLRSLCRLPFWWFAFRLRLLDGNLDRLYSTQPLLTTLGFRFGQRCQPPFHFVCSVFVRSTYSVLSLECAARTFRLGLLCPSHERHGPVLWRVPTAAGFQQLAHQGVVAACFHGLAAVRNYASHGVQAGSSQCSELRLLRFCRVRQRLLAQERVRAGRPDLHRPNLLVFVRPHLHHVLIIGRQTLSGLPRRSGT